MTSPLTPPTTGPALPSARRANTGVEATTRNAFLIIGAATAPWTVQTGQMSRLRARRESAGTVSSSVRTIIAPLSLQSATGGTIVGIGVMRKTATMSVRSTSSSARSRVVASLVPGSVMEMPTVWMGWQTCEWHRFGDHGPWRASNTALENRDLRDAEARALPDGGMHHFGTFFQLGLQELSDLNLFNS